VGVNAPTAHVTWKPCWRIIPSRFPPIQLFERVADPADLEAVMEIEGLTNPRLRDEVGDIRLVPPRDRLSGPGTSAIMAAFTHLNPEGSRFTDGSFGVFYAGRELETAIDETKHHRARFIRATNQGRMELDMRAYATDLEGSLHDLRGRQGEFPAVYHPENYAASQHLASALRKDGSNGIAYDSIRHPGGACVAVFRPSVLSNCRQERHLCYVWDGQRFTTIYEKRQFQ
jgi:hypothetical protein